MKGVKMNYQKYMSYPTVAISGRTWPDQVISRAPVWCSVDLRDGNQALDVPMDIDQKMALFTVLVNIGFKEIEVGFPAASAVEFAFVRKLIEEDRIPQDVTIQVLTQARPDLIKRTFTAVQGARQAIVHVYNSTSVAQRKVVFRMGQEEIKHLAMEGVSLVKDLACQSGKTHIQLEYSPESFTGTELDYALNICEAVKDIWAPTPQDKMIINLPSTVEMSTPNIFADRIEWFSKQISGRESVIISVHTHNDRGTAVAAAELAVMAGADRVEGALFGNGERSGNMDIITMALNLFSQGVDPCLDFRHINEIRDVYQQCTRMPVHPRHPYCGDLVYTAFSGSHQDAISKGMRAHRSSGAQHWDVPYLPIDPQDIGRSYEALIRINSQSGKGGIAYVLEKDFGLEIPHWMQRDVGRVIQKEADRMGRELSAKAIYDVFIGSYQKIKKPLEWVRCFHSDSDNRTDRPQDLDTDIRLKVRFQGCPKTVVGKGNGPVDAVVKALEREFNLGLRLIRYFEHAIAQGSDAQAIAYVQFEDAQKKSYFGVGIDPNIVHASVKSVISGVNHFWAEQKDAD
jgi:2-isopropylmalate synthase